MSIQNIVEMLICAMCREYTKNKTEAKDMTMVAKFSGKRGTIGLFMRGKTLSATGWVTTQSAEWSGTDIPHKNQSTLDLRLGQKFTLLHENDPNDRVRTTL